VAGVPADVVAGQLLAAEVVGTEGVDLVARGMAPVPAGVAPAGR
jgi:ribosomal protein S12 methylthiotransferase